MRGRKPRPLTIAPADAAILQAVSRSRHLSFYQVQHARIVLAVAAGEPICCLSSEVRDSPGRLASGATPTISSRFS